MQSSLEEADIQEQKFLHQMLIDVKKETSTTRLLNKTILIKLLALKLKHAEKFKKLSGGYSSNTYCYEEENIVLRFPKPYNPLYRHASIEIHNLSLAKKLDLTPLDVVAYYTKCSLLLTQFIPSYQSYSEKDFKAADKLIALAHLIKKLHYSQAVFKKNLETPLSFIDASSKTFQTIKSILTEEDYNLLLKLAEIRIILAKFKIKKFPSHGDFHYFNLIEINGNMQLMDWEFSSIEDPAYDISRFFCVANFQAEQKKIFLQAYQNSFNNKLSENEFNNLKKRIQLFEPLNYFSIVVWAKYAHLFFYGEQRKLLEETIKNFTEKTLSTLEKIDLVCFNSQYQIANPTTYPGHYYCLFKKTSENEPTIESDQRSGPSIHSCF